VYNTACCVSFIYLFCYCFNVGLRYDKLHIKEIYSMIWYANKCGGVVSEIFIEDNGNLIRKFNGIANENKWRWERELGWILPHENDRKLRTILADVYWLCTADHWPAFRGSSSTLQDRSSWPGRSVRRQAEVRRSCRPMPSSDATHSTMLDTVYPTLMSRRRLYVQDFASRSLLYTLMLAGHLVTSSSHAHHGRIFRNARGRQ